MTTQDIADLPVLHMPRLGERWTERAACRGMATRDFDPWHPDDHDHGLTAWARKVCEHCPVRPQCLDYHLRVLEADPFAVQGMIAGYRPDELQELVDNGPEGMVGS